MRRICASIILVFALCSTLIGCVPFKYSGEHSDLYTVAINSLLWIGGFGMQADFPCDPEIEIIEIDECGRILFTYSEETYSDTFASANVLILQATKGNLVYFYEDHNFIIERKKLYSDFSFGEFDEQEIADLKEKNDWNKELNLEKCIVKEVSFSKKDNPVDYGQLETIFCQYDNYSSHVSRYFTEDEYGNFLIHSKVRFNTENETRDYRYFVLLFKKDSSYAIFEPQSLYNYQDELKQFKEANSWNCPSE